MTQRELAERLGVATQTVHRWEAGKTSIPTSRRGELAEMFPYELGAVMVPSPQPAALQGAEQAEGAEAPASWGHVVITFRGGAPSIARSITDKAHEQGWRVAWRRARFFSVTDLRGRFLLVNRGHVERLQLLSGADGRAAGELLAAGHDAAPSEALGLLGGAVNVHLSSGLSLERAANERLLASLSTIADELEFWSDTPEGGVDPFLQLESPSGAHVELIAWRDVAWLEASAVEVHGAFRRRLEAEDEG